MIDERWRDVRRVLAVRLDNLGDVLVTTPALPAIKQSLPAAYLCYLADVPLRVAASIDGPGSLLTTRHKHPERMMHEVERGLDLVGAIGLGTGDLDLVLAVPEDARGACSDM